MMTGGHVKAVVEGRMIGHGPQTWLANATGSSPRRGPRAPRQGLKMIGRKSSDLVEPRGTVKDGLGTASKAGCARRTTFLFKSQM